MSYHVTAEVPVRAYRRAGFATFAVLGLTTVHHLYGAVVYDTPWRFHVAIIAPILAVATARALYLGGSQRGTRPGIAWTRIAAALILIFPIGLVGLVEGGYNHVIKNLLYLVCGPRSARVFFPPPLYEMPNNLLFEATGIAQFPLGLVAAHFLIGVLRRARIAA